MRALLRPALLAALASLALSAAGAASASAAPVWKFNGKLLTGSEKILAKAVNERFTIPGVTTECAHATMKLEITNGGGASGTAKVVEFSGEGCTAGSNCSVESFEAKKLPWSAHLATFAGKDYFVIEGIELEIRYGGSLCVFAGVPVFVKGSAGGVVENATEAITFDEASETATGTALKVGMSTVVWDAVFVTEALGAHKGESLEG